VLVLQKNWYCFIPGGNVYDVQELVRSNKAFGKITFYRFATTFGAANRSRNPKSHINKSWFIGYVFSGAHVWAKGWLPAEERLSIVLQGTHGRPPPPLFVCFPGADGQFPLGG
jgi:hypothetical protein